MFGLPSCISASTLTGNVAVVDSDFRKVTVHSPTGAVIMAISPDHLGQPTHVALADNGQVYVSDAVHSAIKV